jgi:hypothetical protein
MARYQQELEILRKLVNGEAVSLSSQLRIRLELAGAIESARHHRDRDRTAKAVPAQIDLLTRGG